MAGENPATGKNITPALLVLRVTLGIFLMQWGLEKFIVPQNTPAIWNYFYGLDMPQAAAYFFGVVEIALAGCLILGLFRTIAYAAAMLLHAVTVLVTWRQLLDPWADPVNHLFIAGVPVLGAFIALFLLREFDRGILDRAAP
jgi:putative oxidoreductase